MTKLTFVAAALVAVAAYATEAASARSNPPARHNQTTTMSAIGNCVRAPNAGAFASAPYSVPPCMPNQAN
jgi:hypothetical protein